MRRWGLAPWLCMLYGSVASAQSTGGGGDVATTASTAPEEAPPIVIGYGALPGGIHAPSAQLLPKGTFAIESLGGFGYRSGLLPGDHSFSRGVGSLAFAYAIHDLVSIAVALDGRYDRHSGVPPTADGGKEDGYVGDPRVILRAGKAMGNLAVGGQLGVWVPGKDAPSVAASAISVDARGLLTVEAGPGSLSFSAGFRLDNSAESVDMPQMLSLADRVSLGVSEFNAVVGGAYVTLPVGKAFVGAEGGIDLFLGDGAPGPLIRGAAHAGLHLNKSWAVLAFVELAKVPGIDAAAAEMNDIALIPYEPMVSGGLGIQGRFGGPRPTAGSDHIVENPDKKDIEQVDYADVAGTVVDENGKPVVGAKVAVKLKNVTGTGATDDKGAFAVTQLPIKKTLKGVVTVDDGVAEVTIEVAGKQPSTQTVTLAPGKNTITRLALEPLLPPGELRAVVRTAGTGKPLAGASVQIEPGGFTVTSAADGTLSLDLAPGNYKATATADGFKEQTLDVVIETNGVALKNFELRK